MDTGVLVPLEEEDEIDTYRGAAGPKRDELTARMEARLLDVLSYPDRHRNCDVHDCASANTPGLSWDPIVRAHHRIFKTRVGNERAQSEEP